MAIIAQLIYSVLVKCPLCKQETDLIDNDNDDDGKISRHIFNNNWDQLKGTDVVCGNCEHEFKLDGMEY